MKRKMHFTTRTEQNIRGHNMTCHRVTSHHISSPPNSNPVEVSGCWEYTDSRPPHPAHTYAKWLSEQFINLFVATARTEKSVRSHFRQYHDMTWRIMGLCCRRPLHLSISYQPFISYHVITHTLQITLTTCAAFPRLPFTQHEKKDVYV